MTREEELETDLDAAIEAIKAKDKEIKELINKAKSFNLEIAMLNSRIAEIKQASNEKIQSLERYENFYYTTDDATEHWKDEVLSEIKKKFSLEELEIILKTKENERVIKKVIPRNRKKK